MTITPPTPASVSPVYISGPMFSVADKWQQQAIADALLAAGMSSYLPQRDGIEVAQLMSHVNDDPNNISPQVVAEVVLFIREIVFAMDMFQLIERCNSLVFNMDGRVPDEGSVSETAAAFASGQTVVIYKTTPITFLGGTDNPMVSGLSLNWATVGDVTLLAQAVLAAAGVNGTRFTPGSQCSAVIKLGNVVWNNMPAIDKILEGMDPTNPSKTIDALLALKQEWLTLLEAAYPEGPAVGAGVGASTIDLRHA
jgi:nucleoside 2-deoxyribosyltransferase